MSALAMEFVAAQAGQRHQGALVLSEFTGGGAAWLRGALTCNPYDAAGLADAVHHALAMSADAKQAQ
jgi:trehalose-6-phosphate synthase